jgi:hypothetical protein
MALSSPASVAHGRTLPEGGKAVPVRTLSPEQRAAARTSRRHPSGSVLPLIPSRATAPRPAAPEPQTNRRPLTRPSGR